METRVITQSPWAYDQPFISVSNIQQDFNMSSITIEDAERLKSWDDLSNHSNSATSTVSSASSECDEDLLPVMDDFNINTFENELFNNLGGWLNGPLIQDQICGEETWNNPSIETCSSELSSDSNSVLSSPPHSPSRSRQQPGLLMSNLSWSSMSDQQQLQTVEMLTEIISTEMDLREQLEIIRIIDSDAVISPTDTEFAIDLSCLNDKKLEEFRSYVDKYISRKNTKITSCPSENSHKAQSLHTQSNTFNRSKTSKREIAKEKKNQLKAAKQRQKKEYRQLLKEKRSGLFVREEVLALSSCSTQDEEDIDVDIGEEKC